jgi:hypothetical protein
VPEELLKSQFVITRQIGWTKDEIGTYRYVYLKSFENGLLETTPSVKEAKRYTDKDESELVKLSNPDWKFLNVFSAMNRKQFIKYR